MKIGIVCCPTHGGSGVVASELAIGLAKKGHEMHIVSYAPPFRLRTFHQNIFVHAAEAAAPPSFRRVVKFAIEKSDGVTAVSRYLKNRTIEEFDIRREIRVIPNFIEVVRASADLEACNREAFAPRNEKILMHASNFRPVKRIGDVVRIFARVRDEIPTKLLLVGEGPERLFIQQLVRERELGADVHFLGEQDQLEPLFFCTDLFLLPSEQESFGLTALEAMNCGVPVIAADVGGLPEVIIPGETGYLLPVGDIEGMAAKAVELLSDPVRHSLFRTQARRRAEQHFDAVRIIPQYETLYEELL